MLVPSLLGSEIILFLTKRQLASSCCGSLTLSISQDWSKIRMPNYYLTMRNTSVLHTGRPCLHNQRITFCGDRPPWHTKAQSHNRRLLGDNRIRKGTSWIQNLMGRPEAAGSIQLLNRHSLASGPDSSVLLPKVPSLLSGNVRMGAAHVGLSSPFLCFHYWPTLLQTDTFLFRS